jgi:probable HAF family extracellular repeat protein
MRGAHRWIVAIAALLIDVLAPTGGGAAGAAVPQPPAGGRQITVTALTTGSGEALDGSYVELNERGQVASVIYRTEPLESVPVLWHRGRVTRLSPDVRYARPLDLSDRGHVVGQYYQLTEPRGIYPFAWSRREWTQLTSGEATGWALDVNRRGQVVGRLDRPPYTIVWDDGEPIPPPPGAGYGLINDRGQVLGGVANETGQAEAATWHLGDPTVTRLGTLGGGYSQGVAINESGDIAGDSLTADGEERAFLWRDGEMIDLGSLGSTDTYPASEALALNNRGQVVGYSHLSHGGPHAFLWEDGTMIDIGALADEDGPSKPADINDRGQIVGNLYGDWPNEAVLWTAPPR